MSALAVGLAISAAAQSATADHALDFWIGKWNVFVNRKVVGTDVVEKTLKGFGVIEHWKDLEGNQGKSLFYYMPAKRQWKQVWITEEGVFKEKYSEPVPGGMRFSGRVFLPNGKSFSDRTTLTRLERGRLHQVIESARDGKTWKTTFDAIYEPAEIDLSPTLLLKP